MAPNAFRRPGSSLNMVHRCIKDPTLAVVEETAVCVEQHEDGHGIAFAPT
jgi:hypothetical protein